MSACVTMTTVLLLSSNARHIESWMRSGALPNLLCYKYRLQKQDGRGEASPPPHSRVMCNRTSQPGGIGWKPALMLAFPFGKLGGLWMPGVDQGTLGQPWGRDADWHSTVFLTLRSLGALEVYVLVGTNTVIQDDGRCVWPCISSSGHRSSVGPPCWYSPRPAGV